MAIVRYTMEEILNLAKENSDETKKRLSQMKDEDIDYSDIPEITEEEFKNAIPIGEFLEQKRKEREHKKLLVEAFSELDDDVQILIKNYSKNSAYKKHINSVLRALLTTLPSEK